ncbi:ABC transporter permease [Actinomyces gerencseriae]
MSTFKTCVRVVAAHRLYILIYLVLLSVFGLLTGMARSEDDSSQVTTATASVAVIDRDGTTISRGIKDYVESVGKVQPLEDSTRAIQDATAQNRVNYVLIIPAGYGQQLQQATRQGIEPPRMDTVIGYESASGALMNVRTDSYTGQVADYLATLTDDPTRAVALAEETMSHSAPAERIAQDATPLPHDLTVYAQFSLYPLVAFAVVAISALMTALGRRAVRSRLDAAPVSGGARNLGLLGACLVVGVVGWLWILGLGVAVFGAGSVTTSAPLLGVVGAALGSYMLVAVSLGFLVGQFGLGQNAANAVANIGGMALSFLAGAWVPIEWMPDAIARTARLTPGYWADQAISGAYNATSMSADVIRPLLVDCGICTLFAVAVLSVAMAVGRTRARSTL